MRECVCSMGYRGYDIDIYGEDITRSPRKSTKYDPPIKADDGVVDCMGKLFIFDDDSRYSWLNEANAEDKNLLIRFTRGGVRIYISGWRRTIAATNPRQDYYWLPIYASTTRISVSLTSSIEHSLHIGYVYHIDSGSAFECAHWPETDRKIRDEIHVLDCYMTGNVFKVVTRDPDGRVCYTSQHCIPWPGQDVYELRGVALAKAEIDYRLEQGKDGKSPVLPGLEKIVTGVKTPKPKKVKS